MARGKERPGRDAAIEAVREAMTKAGFPKAAQLASETGLSSDTVRDFLNGERWPQQGTLNLIEAAIGMRHGALTAYSEEDTAFFERRQAAATPPPAEPSPTGSGSIEDALVEVAVLRRLLARAEATLELYRRTESLHD